MHKEAYAYVQKHVAALSFDRVVEFGSLDINGSVRGLFDCDEYHGIDLQEGPGVDEVADVVDWRGEPADAVVCCEVLEHAPDVLGIIESAFVNLKQNGLLVITCATGHRKPHSAVDGGRLRQDEWYRNVEVDDLKTYFTNLFGILDLTVVGERGDLYCVARKLS